MRIDLVAIQPGGARSERKHSAKSAHNAALINQTDPQQIRRMKNLNWQNPYPSARRPLLARNVVSTSQPLAAQAGLRMLQAGGNAVDAALATAMCLPIL